MVTCPGDAGLNAAPAELAWLRRRVAEPEARNEVLAAQLAARNAQLEAAQAKLTVLAEQAEELRRGLSKDSSTSSKPSSSDSPYPKRSRDRSLRGRSGRKWRLSAGQLAEIRSRYRGAVAKGITDNQNQRSQTGKDGLRLARRFRDHQDVILRFATDLTVGFTSNEVERGVRPVKVQQRTSG